MAKAPSKTPVKAAPKAPAKPAAKAPVAAAKPPIKASAKAVKAPAKALTKSQLIVELAAKTGGTKKDVNAFLDTFVAIAYREAKKVGEFTIPGIGKLVKQKRLARMGRNPKTGEKLKIAAKTVVKLRVAKAAKDAVLGAK
jgi:DNA-binding protein HU-beta